MRIVIDSNIFILGIGEIDHNSVKLLEKIVDFNVIIPRLIIQEVVKNLAEIKYNLPKKFFRLIYSSKAFKIDERKIPKQLIEKYKRLGVKKEADAAIGGFVEWVKAQYLISGNRHFLEEAKPTKFKILTAKEFLKMIEK